MTAEKHTPRARGGRKKGAKNKIPAKVTKTFRLTPEVLALIDKYYEWGTAGETIERLIKEDIKKRFGDGR